MFLDGVYIIGVYGWVTVDDRVFEELLQYDEHKLRRLINIQENNLDHCENDLELYKVLWGLELLKKAYNHKKMVNRLER